MPRQLPPLNAVRAFEAAARHLSFTQAAAELHVTPAAISHQIKGLEAHLGVALFRREPRRLLLTDAGQRALPGLREAFDHMAEALAAVQPREEGRVLTVSVVPSLASKWLLPRLEGFRRAHPEIEMRLDASARLVDFERDTDVDLAIRHGTGDYPGLHVDALLPAARVPVCRPALLNGAPPLRTPQDLRHHTLLHVPWQCCSDLDPDWPEWLATAGVTGIDTRRGPRFNEHAYAIQAAIDGAGVLLASTVLVADDLAAGRLVVPFGSAGDEGGGEGDGTHQEGLGAGDYGYYLVVPPAKLSLDRVRAFRDWVRAAAAARRAAPDAADVESKSDTGSQAT